MLGDVVDGRWMRSPSEIELRVFYDRMSRRWVFGKIFEHYRVARILCDPQPKYWRVFLHSRKYMAALLVAIERSIPKNYAAKKNVKDVPVGGVYFDTAAAFVIARWLHLSIKEIQEMPSSVFVAAAEFAKHCEEMSVWQNVSAQAGREAPKTDWHRKVVDESSPIQAKKKYTVNPELSAEEKEFFGLTPH